MIIATHMQDLERIFAVSSLFVQRTWLDCLKQSNPITQVEITSMQELYKMFARTARRPSRLARGRS